MDNSILQRFLDIGMLNIGEEDEKYKHLQSTSQDLAKSLSEKRTQLVNYTLVGLDPNIPPDEPVLLSVEKAIKEHWKTYKNRFPDVARQLLRAIILEALQFAGSQDSAIASIIWLTGGSFLPFSDLGRERTICRDLLIRMGDAAEKQGAEAWATSFADTKCKFPPFAAKLPKLEKAVIDGEELKNLLVAASGPQSPDGNHNPHWSNTGAPWCKEFAPRAATAIAQVINNSYVTVLGGVAKYLKNLDAEFTSYSTVLDSVVQQATNELSRGVAANGRRDQLLWWKQTLYSPSIQRSYRVLKSSTAAILMAYDLHHQVSEYCPQSVEYLLRENVACVTNRQETHSLMSICDALRSDEDIIEWRQKFGHHTESLSRTSMLGFVENVLAGSIVEPVRIQRMVGVEPNLAISLEDWSVWIFRDLQARRLASAGR